MTYLFALFVFGHSFALAQDTPDEITKHQLAESSERAKIILDEMSKYEERYSRLFDEYTTNLRRMANSVESHAAREREFNILLKVGNDLNSTNSDFLTLRGYMHLTGMVTRKQFLPRAMDTVTLQRTTMIKRTRVYSQFIEQSLHLSKDQETTRLLLEARDLFRSSAEFLDRLQITDSTTK